MSIYLDEFETLYGISDNIEKLRSKILDYAFKGELIKKNKNEISAKNLVESIRKSRKKMIENKEIRKPRGGVDSVDLDEKPHSLPDYWEWDKIGYIFNIYNGDSINRKLKERKYMKVKDGYDYIGTKDVGYHGEINYKTDVKIPFDEKDDFSIAPPNRPLICCEGGSAGKKIGFTDRNIAFGNKLFAVESFGDFNYKFLFYYYQSNTFYEQFKSKLKGVIGGVSMGRFREIYIPIPPLEEQKRIVEKIEKLMKEVDKLETKLEQKEDISQQLSESIVEAIKSSQDAEELKENLRFIVDNFDVIFKTSESMDEMRNIVLQLAIEGKLVPQDESDEPASELIKKINTGNSSNKIKEENKYFKIPSSWVWTKYDNIIDIRRGASPRPIKKYLTEDENGVHWIKIGDATSGGDIIKHTKEKITEEGAKKSVYITPGTLIMSNSMSYGKPYISGIHGCVHDGWLVFNYDEDLLDTRFLKIALSASYKYFKEKAAGSGIKNLNISRVASTSVPVPPYKEQKRIVNKVDSIMGIIDKLEMELEKKEDLVEKLGSI